MLPVSAVDQFHTDGGLCVCLFIPTPRPVHSAGVKSSDRGKCKLPPLIFLHINLQTRLTLQIKYWNIIHTGDFI